MIILLGKIEGGRDRDQCLFVEILLINAVLNELLRSYLIDGWRAVVGGNARQDWSFISLFVLG